MNTGCHSLRMIIHDELEADMRNLNLRYNENYIVKTRGLTRIVTF